MTLATPPLRDLAIRLIAEEREEDTLLAAFSACQRLGRLLTKVVGAPGFHALLSRAVALTQKEAPALKDIRVLPDSTLSGLQLAADPAEKEELTKGATVLLAQLLGLLHAFIGEPLTTQLVKEAWPEVFARIIIPKKGKTP